MDTLGYYDWENSEDRKDPEPIRPEQWILYLTVVIIVILLVCD